MTLAHDGQERLRGFGGGHPLEHTFGERIHRGVRADSASTGRHELGLDLPPSIDRLTDQRGSFHDERTVVGTRTAAPREAPQSLNLGAREHEPMIGRMARCAQSAALAEATSALNAAASVMARSASILRSISMPAALRPAMNRL